jgi:FAD/FMN-containing dehydrogenase
MPLSAGALAQLKANVKGQVILPGEPNYDESRKLWNAMIDRRPAVIVRPREAADVPHALRAVRENGLDIAIRGAGHNVAGNGVSDGGLTIDFSGMRAVRVDAAARRAFVEPGATLGDVDAATQPHGLAVPVGINSTTGIAGLTLGGGLGWLTRKYGMTIDSLLAADAVTADGRRVRASAAENPDLYWALRGGGGNFAVVTGFEFQLHPLGPEIVAGLIIFPFEQTGQIFRQYRQWCETAPEEVVAWIVLRHAPPLPFLPAEAHGRKVAVVAVVYVGQPSGAGEHIATLRSMGQPLGEHVGPMPFVQWQKAFDPLMEAGLRNYWKTHNFTELSDGAVAKFVEYGAKLPSPHSEVFIGSAAGAANRVAPEATAWAHRQTKYVMNVHARWETAPEDQACIAWARGLFQDLTPFASSGAYVNFMSADEGDRVAAAYAANYPRLARIKKQYDPENVFHLNQNIKPQ